jgi:hypothetical protein
MTEEHVNDLKVSAALLLGFAGLIAGAGVVLYVVSLVAHGLVGLIW